MAFDGVMEQCPEQDVYLLKLEVLKVPIVT